MKKRSILVLIVLSIALSGCSAVNTIIEKQIKKNSGIEDDPDYNQYLLHMENGKTDENGYYLFEKDDTSDNTTPIVKDGIHITFANNNLLNITYYSDINHQSELNINECYLKPGDTIYASVPVSVTNLTNKYEFDKYLIYEFINNEKTILDETTGMDGIVFTIPADYTGKELSIVPLGTLSDRIITVKALFCDEQGEKEINQGNWYINGKQINDNTCSFDATKTFIVKYDYTSFMQDYYFVECEPLINNDLDGIITFCSQSSNSTVDEFWVKLRRYTTLTIENKRNALIGGSYGIESLIINGTETDKDQSKFEWKHMKNGDVIELIIKDGFKLTSTSTNNDLILSQPLSVSNGTRYTITINSSKDYSPTITISKETATQGEYTQRRISNGTISLRKEDGTVITDGDIVDDNEKVTVFILPDYGYYVTGKDVKNSEYHKTMKYTDFIKNREKIIDEHPIHKYIQLTLNTEDLYGDCEFTLNKEVVKGRIEAKENEVIKLSYSLTDPDYQIDKSGIVSVIDNILNRNQATVTIKVTEDMDGKTISREDYITISRK